MSAATRSAVAPAMEAEPENRSAGPIAFGPLASSLGFHLRLAQIEAFEAFFATFAEDGLQPGSFCVLITIGENPGIRQGILANALKIKRSHMAKRPGSSSAGFRRTIGAPSS